MKYRVLLVNPPENEQVTFNNPPLGLLYLAGSLKKAGIIVKVLDGCFGGWPSVESEIRNFKPTLVGVSCLTPTRFKSYQVAQIAKNINPIILTVLGGVHATIMHQQILSNQPEVDVIVRGEGETVITNLALGKPFTKIKGISYRNNGIVKENLPEPSITSLDSIPFPAWELIDLSKYPPLSTGIKEHNGVNMEKEPRVSVILTRGCPGHCNFCSTWWIWRGWRGRSGKNMADEIELLYKKYNVRHFCFADDCMTANIQNTIDLCDEIIKRKLKIAFNVTTRTDAVNIRVLRKLKQAGCYTINYGIETASPKLLDIMEKVNNVSNSAKAIALTKKAGIRVTALMITGNIGENFTTVNQSIRFLQKTKPDFIGTVGGLWVFPGTKIYRQLCAEGKIDDSFWLTQKTMMVYRGIFSDRQLRYIRFNMERRQLIDPKKKSWNSPSFLIFYYLEKWSKKNRLIKNSLVGLYKYFDVFFKSKVK